MSPPAQKPRARGFTFIEVLIAMAIFTIAVLAAIDITSGSVRATRDAREVSVASWLLQQKMVELETKLETDGVEKACEKKDNGKFGEPYETFTWDSSCDEVDFQLSESAAKMTEGDDEDKNTSENQILKLILKTASDYITQSVREVHVAVNWTSGKAKHSVDATTHFVRYDQKVSIGGVTGGGGGTAPGGDGTTPDKGAGTTTQ
jgi:type II secretion system protein I